MANATEEWYRIPESILDEIEDAVVTSEVDVDLNTDNEDERLISENLVPGTGISLSERGKKLVASWKGLFKANGNSDKIMEQFSDLMLDFSFLGCFSEPVPDVSGASLYLLDKIDVIVASGVTSLPARSASISAREADIIEYIAGFILRRIESRYVRFPEHYAVLEILEASSPSGVLIPLLENRRLVYPSLELQSFLQRIFLDVSKEFSKLESVDIEKLQSVVIVSTYFDNFIDYVDNAGQFQKEVIKKIINTISTLFIRTLAFSFTKKLVEKLMNFKSGSSSLSFRGNLNKQCSSK